MSFGSVPQDTVETSLRTRKDEKIPLGKMPFSITTVYPHQIEQTNIRTNKIM